MTDILEPRALLLTGPYGAGKSALVAEIAGLLEGRVPFAAIDLDWLAWYDDGVTPGHSLAAFEMLARNLTSVVGNYREAAVGHFLLAGAILDEASHARLVVAMGMPIRVVRISAPLSEIERRLEVDPTSGRADDLREARAWIATGEVLPFEDDAVVNVGPIRAVAEGILARWLES
jgi:energy-coupling factor transporter ATP-binding protein EcfA2